MQSPGTGYTLTPGRSRIHLQHVYGRRNLQEQQSAQRLPGSTVNLELAVDGMSQLDCIAPPAGSAGQPRALARRVSTQSDSEHFDSDFSAAISARPQDRSQVLLASLPAPPPPPGLRAMSRLVDTEGNVESLTNIVGTGRSYTTLSGYGTEASSTDFGLLDGADSLLQLDHDSVLSAWMMEVISSPHDGLDCPIAAHRHSSTVSDAREMDSLTTNPAVQHCRSDVASSPVECVRDGKSPAASTESLDALDQNIWTANDSNHSASPLTSSRAAALARYRDKRQRRRFGQSARYDLRKANADRRPRIRGRFVGRAQAAAMRACEAAADLADAPKAF